MIIFVNSLCWSFVLRYCLLELGLRLGDWFVGLAFSSAL